MKPRLTSKVLEGLATLSALVDPDYADPPTQAAIEWVHRMRQYRAERAAELKAHPRRDPAWDQF